MSEKNNGGPAFPSGNEVRVGPCVTQGHAGMTLRDYFAAKAMQAYISRGPNLENGEFDDVVSRWSYEAADAMLKAKDA